MQHKRQPIGPAVVEETGVVHLGTKPSEQYGWECAECHEVSGLRYGGYSEAQRALTAHEAAEHS